MSPADSILFVSAAMLSMFFPTADSNCLQRSSCDSRRSHNYCNILDWVAKVLDWDSMDLDCATIAAAIVGFDAPAIFARRVKYRFVTRIAETSDTNCQRC